MRVISRKIVGYDRDAGISVFEYPIPPHSWPDALSVINRNDRDHDCIFTYELDASQTHKLMRMVGEQPRNALKYFLECEWRA